MRIERALDRAHHVDRGLAVLGDQRVELVDADPVLAGAGAAHADRAQRHALREGLGPLALGRRPSDRTARAGGSCRRRRGRRSGRRVPTRSTSSRVSRMQSASRRDRHAGVGREAHRTRPQRQRGVPRVVARLPQLASAPPAALAQRKAPPPCSAAIASISSRLLLHARGGAVELEEQRRLRLVALELRVADARAASARRRGARCARRECRAASPRSPSAPRARRSANWHTAAEIASGTP